MAMNGKYRRFIFKRPFTCKFGEIPVGSELTVLGEKMMFNGGFMEPWYYGIFWTIIEDKEKFDYYLKEVAIPYNKI